MVKSSVPLITAVCLLAGSLTATAADEELVIGFVESAEPDFIESTISPTISAIGGAMPEYKIRLERLSSLTLSSDIRLYQPDVIIAPVSDTVTLLDSQEGVHPVATRKTILAADPAHSIGGAVIVRTDRTDIQGLDDLRDTRLIATLPNAIDGWLALSDELGRTPREAKRYFSQVSFAGYGFPTVISAVLSGTYDAGVIPACLLERVIEDGLVERNVLRVLAPRDDSMLACRHTTALYPDIVVSTLPDTESKLARRLTIALLSASTNKSGYSWQVTSNFHAVRALQERLHLGVWSYLEDRSFSSLWNRYSGYVVFAFCILLFLLLNEWRLRWLVKTRTKALNDSFIEQDRLRVAEQQARDKLKKLEHMGAISQLCAMIAHELKQPVTSVINYTAILNLKLVQKPSTQPDGDQTTVKAVQGAEREARRIAKIVDRVRSYARFDRSAHERINLIAALKVAVKEADHYRVGRVVLLPAQMPQEILIYGHELEIELLFINVLKNAFEALSAARDTIPDPTVKIVLSELTDGIQVEVIDNGPPVSDEVFSRLTAVSESVKPEGLGLGLAIVRNIADEHGASFHVRRIQPSGIAVSLIFPRLKDLPDAPVQADTDGEQK